ncbi:MAG TPA: NAD(P)-dependent oxidoreductase [Solirubrobacteraceae bacterium]|jgi:nucleoside-diphosphate-sugar epimerase|nr:NAD(P)-dependent oxidoreductase [Solirubrobacteraceae bacterium]
MRVFVTGASGFLGRVVCAQLLEREHVVGVLVRRAGSEPPGCEPARGDLSDTATLTRALQEAGADCVVHLAAEIATQRSRRRIDEVNVEGTRRLLHACTAAGGPRVVFASTVVTGDAGGAVLSEDAPLPVRTAYGHSKQQGEKLVRESGLPSVILRPSHVYGPGGWFAQEIVGRLRAPGRLAIVGSGLNWWDVVRVEDVATAVCESVERAPSGSIYHVVDDDPVTYAEFVGFAASALGRGPARRIPAPIARLVAGADPVRAVTRSARSSNALIKQELGWEPRWPTSREGVPDAVARIPARA